MQFTHNVLFLAAALPAILVAADCDFPGTTEFNKPHTCSVPLSNDAALPGRDVIIRNGQGACVDGECGCTLAGISYDDLLNACADLAPDQTTPLPNTSGTDVKTQPGRYCYHGVYRVPTPERK
ncbi:unnamed protein product [Zymoseptoria tritici ST99CH_3D1]|nr:unnamed protein product [Zymoseptoria tritici ST99CH_3D1]